MVQANPKLLSVEDFIANHGDQDRYELIDGELIDLEPTGLHEQRLFQQDEGLISPTFPELRLRASAIFAAGQL